METVNERIDQIVEEFVDLDAREKLELLLYFANRLPPLSADYLAKKENEDRKKLIDFKGFRPNGGQI